MSDFETDFAPMFDVPLEPVEVRENPSVSEFEEYRKRPRPLVISGLTKKWPALTKWSDPDYLCAKVGAETIFYRNLVRAKEAAEYTEIYEQSTFEGFMRELIRDPSCGKYLTQANIIRPLGHRQALEREAYPARINALADDLINPPYFPDRFIYEANMWLGPGNQNSGLHFDEFDNLNCPVLGEKRWLIFPHDEYTKLLGSGGSRDSIALGFDAGEKRRFDDSGRRRARGYQCVTRPGEVLFVPAGFWHQVFSGPTLSLAVNYWYAPHSASEYRTCIGLFAHRLTGHNSRLKHAFASTGLVAHLANQYSRYALLRLRGQQLQPPPLGPSGYRMRTL